jgi:hypothetical protein
VSEILLERHFDPPLTPQDVLAMAGADEASQCFGLHRVTWRMSFLASTGGQMVCWFSGPDAQSVRTALRQVGADVRRLWPGTVHDAPGLDADSFDGANVLVERAFREPVPVDEIQALEDAGAGCLQTHGVRFVRTFAALDGRRMLCLYRAPDAESVRVAQRRAGVPMERAWAFRRVAFPEQSSPPIRPPG